ncbi:uncharacterized protein BDR25DRAFT_218046 [Lindgomyces ingoldianus]|uniref:Uncharacterized protein n=1 Tax=Lindgomyces ingoldianus TaxID=673940 RepID=A0ACB6R262_9PLEO|nr:uncharacterized protein BDR25DRAFT_218046 [Lindgomyces ingoldianus]KAF2473231.1 hypothetical protein BDR25DRAFT_218046 [Lindgomyces ingoldianus]
MLSAHQSTPPPTINPASTTTIKMEDISMSFPHSAPLAPPASNLSQTPPPSSSESKPVKKRKSWGQVLPEPKTSLPPRKRAKTEDEKEQRRIERVKRNRLAAHNSRERKRQEVELLLDEKKSLEQELAVAREAMRKMAAELRSFKELHPNDDPTQRFSSSTPSGEDYESVLHSSETICPRQTSFPSPVSMDSLDSPSRDESSQPDTPGYTESVSTEFDPTRYPAAILCDLLEPTAFDEKPMDLLFDFESFPDSSLATQPDVFSSTVFQDFSSSNPYGLSDQFGAKNFDLQNDSSALVSDDVLVLEV